MTQLDKPGAPTPEELLSLGQALSTSGLVAYQDGFAEILSWLTAEERLLFTSLTAKFNVCEFDVYLGQAVALCAAIINQWPLDSRRIILLPLVDPESQSKPKSGEGVAWLMSRELARLASESGIEFEMVSRSLKASTIERADESTFVLVDDFIGSGKTAEKALAWLGRQGVPAERSLVACFVGLRDGRERVVGAGGRPIFLKTLERGISDSMDIVDKERALHVMAQVESRNGVSERFRFGYEAGEALALMCFCPNNTFPVFWWNGSRWKGVLQR